MKKKPGIILLLFFIAINTFAQNQLFKGKNLLLPSNLIVNYVVRMDSCYKLIDGQCLDTISKAFLKDNQKMDLLGTIVDSALAGKVNCYKTDSWLTYQLMENTEKLSLNELDKKLDITDYHPYEKSQIIGLDFIEEWEVTNNPIAFKKNVLAYMPVRCYYNQDDSCNDNPLYQIPFTILDTLTKKSQIKKSAKRMMLTNEIESEYFLYLDYTLPYDVNELTKTYKKSRQGVGDYLLRKETAEYLTESGINNFLRVLFEKLIKGEINAYDYNNNLPLTINEIKQKMGMEVLVEQDSIIDDHELNTNLQPMYFEEIQSVIFLEEWYIDPINLRMQKKVIGIAPVRHFYKQNDEFEENLNREILFKVYFEKKKKFQLFKKNHSNE